MYVPPILPTKVILVSGRRLHMQAILLSSFDRAFTLLFQSAVAAGAYLGDRSIRNSLCRKEEEEKKEEKSRE